MKSFTLEQLRDLKELADQGNPLCQWGYGICLLNGNGVPRNLALGAEYLKKAADQGDAGSQYYYGLCLAKGEGVSKNLELAAKYYKKSADQGNSDGQFKYGLCLAKGEGVSKNLELAAEYYKKSADQGNLDGQCNYGTCLYHGEGVAKNLLVAAEYFKKSADQGNSDAQNNYGVCLAKGEGVSKNLALAAEYFKKSADQGNPLGQYTYGVCLANGDGVPKNLALAAKYYKKAGDQGDFRGQLAYLTCLHNGLGVSENLARAPEYHKKSADQGNSGARERDEKILSMRRKKKCLSDLVTNSEDWKSLKILGHGGYGIVELVEHVESKELCARKTIDEVDSNVFQRECITLNELNHPCVLNIRWICLSNDEGKLELYTEYISGGSLERAMKKGFEDHTKIAMCLSGIISGMCYVHSKRVIHRDLKPSNIFLDSQFHPIIGDFGCSGFDSGGSQTSNVGSVRYMAPEMLAGDAYDYSVDVFSFSVICYEVLSGKDFYGEHMKSPLRIAEAWRRGYRPSLPVLIDKGVSREFVKILEDGFSVNPEERPSFKDFMTVLQELNFRLFHDVDSLSVRQYLEDNHLLASL